MIYRADEEFDAWCPSRFQIVDAHNVKHPTGVQCVVCVSPVLDALATCCINCWTVHVPEVTDGRPEYCYDTPTGRGDNTAPATDVLLHKVPFVFAPSCAWTGQQNFGSCYCIGGALGGFIISLSNIPPSGTAWPCGTMTAKWWLKITWTQCAATSPYGVGYDAFYASDEEGCGTMTFTKMCQTFYSSTTLDTAATWPDTLTLTGSICP